MSVINNTSPTDAVTVVITDSIPLHVSIPLSRYRFRYSCSHDAMESVALEYDIDGYNVPSKECFDSGDINDAAVMSCKVMDYWLDIPGQTSSGGSSMFVATSISSRFVLPPQCTLLMQVTGTNK